MSNDNKTLADARPGGRVRLGDSRESMLESMWVEIRREGDRTFPRVMTKDQAEAFLRTCNVRPIPTTHPLYAALSAQPSPGGKDGLNYERMFVDACAALAEVSRELGCDPEQGGAEPILAAIAELREALAARQPVGDHVAEADDFLSGICVALQCVTAQDCGVLWREIVVAVGIDDLLQYATFIEPEEWELAGFGKYASAELGRRKPRSKASKQSKAPPAQAVDLGQPDPTLLRFYQVSDFPSLVAALEAHVLQLIDLRKRSVKPWEDTMPPTLLPKWVRENSPVLAKDLLALAEKWQDEAAVTWGESPAHAAKQQCCDELRDLIDSQAVRNG